MSISSYLRTRFARPLVLGVVVLSGCTGTDAYITSLYEAPDDDAVVFSTHADHAHWCLRSGQLTSATASEADWAKSVPARLIAPGQQSDGQSKTSFYKLSGNRAIINRMEKRRPSKVIYVDSNGTERIILKESTGRYLARRLASSGLQYP